jgi:hypothetical protein
VNRIRLYCLLISYHTGPTRYTVFEKMTYCKVRNISRGELDGGVGGVDEHVAVAGADSAVALHDFCIWVIERWRSGYGVCDCTAVA